MDGGCKKNHTTFLPDRDSLDGESPELKPVVELLDRPTAKGNWLPAKAKKIKAKIADRNRNREGSSAGATCRHQILICSKNVPF